MSTTKPSLSKPNIRTGIGRTNDYHPLPDMFFSILVRIGMHHFPSEFILQKENHEMRRRSCFLQRGTCHSWDIRSVRISKAQGCHEVFGMKHTVSSISFSDVYNPFVVDIVSFGFGYRRGSPHVEIQRFRVQIQPVSILFDWYKLMKFGEV